MGHFPDALVCGSIYLLPTMTCYVLLAVVTNVILLRQLNARSIQSVETLLHLCPPNAREIYDSWFPSIRYRRCRLCRALRITVQTLGFFVLAPRQSIALAHRMRDAWFASRLRHAGVRYCRAFGEMNNRSVSRLSRALSRLPIHMDTHKPRVPVGAVRRKRGLEVQNTFRLNRAKLAALTLRLEDSSLHAFSAFAALTTFVPGWRPFAPVPGLHMKFLLSYFSPIGFGFLLCLLTFGSYPFVASVAVEPHAVLSRFPFMFCVFFWFVQGAFYLFFTLRQDFAALFRDFFYIRMFPSSMTQFANEQVGHAPNLVDLIQNTWAPWLIATVMFGLATLYADFLHSLG
jgi:hypothetical protein